MDTYIEWCVVRCGSKNEHQNDMCLKDWTTHAQYLLTIPGSIINMIVGAYMII